VSNALAIASVTAVLKDLLTNWLVDHDARSAIGDVTVTALPPDRIDTTRPDQTSQLNLFLYQAFPSTSWRSAAIPLRGRGIEPPPDPNPPLALDLHYLLTAFGAEELHSEILLGYGMQFFHETPIMTPAAVRQSLAPPSGRLGGSSFPSPLPLLSASGLADQVELIRLVPQPMSTTDICNLWAAFQSHYRPSATYQASVILIEKTAPLQAPPAVG
jgi:hypothetical protein